MFAAIGLLAGLLGGLLGVGGGFIMVPLQVLYAGQDQRRANATSLAAVIPIAVVGAVIYYFAGSRPQVDLAFAGLLILGGMVGAYVGARLASRVPEARLRMVVAVLLGLVGLKELVLP